MIHIYIENKVTFSIRHELVIIAWFVSWNIQGSIKDARNNW